MVVELLEQASIGPRAGARTNGGTAFSQTVDKNLEHVFKPKSINRAKQLSRKGELERGVFGNPRSSVIPGTDLSDNYEIVLKDLDTAIMTHVENIMDIRVKENGELVKVPTLYGNSERWDIVRKKGFIRDKNGTLILPLIVFKRTTVEFNTELPSWKHDATGEFIQVVRSSKWSKDNRYTNFAIQTGAKPVEENIITGVPQYVNTTYEFVAHTSYITQMNSIVELFVQQSGTYWGDNTSYRFLCNVDGGLNDVSETAVGTDRVIKTSFNVMLKGYLLPQTISNLIQDKKFNASKQLTVSSIKFTENVE